MFLQAERGQTVENARDAQEVVVARMKPFAAARGPVGRGFDDGLAVFLADRLRQMNAQLTGGKAASTSLEDEEEIDETILDGVHLAGIRFEMILRQMAAG